MLKIAVFDSGLGSLSVIKPIKKKIPSHIIYFADQESYPYGTKTTSQLNKIIKSTISQLQEKFQPDIIVVGSNTPSLLLNIRTKNVIGVFPPLKEASLKTKTKKIGILATRSVIQSRSLDKYIKHNVSSDIKTYKINASPLVDLVESEKFLTQKQFTKNKIKKSISPYVNDNVDVFTLSSTHLPFLLPILQELFPSVIFLDPANSVAEKIAKKLKQKTKNKLEIYASGNIVSFHKKLLKIGIKNKIKKL